MKRLFIFLLSGVFVSGVFGIGSGFLAIPTTAEHLALGSQVTYSSAAPDNPAALHLRTTPQLQLSHGTWLEDTQATTVFYMTNKMNGVLGITGRYVALDGLEYRTDVPTDEPLATFGSYGAFLKAQYARGWNNIRWGIGMKIVNLYIASYHTRGVAFDAGVVKSYSNDMKLGFSLLNLGSFSSWEGRKARFPQRWVVGAEKSWSGSVLSRALFISVESTSQTSGLLARWGGQLFWKQFIINLGYQHSSRVNSISSGIGIRTGRYVVQYGFRFGSQDLTLPQVLDIAINLP